MPLMPVMALATRQAHGHALLLAAAVMQVRVAIANPPHILTILVDDMGWYVTEYLASTIFPCEPDDYARSNDNPSIILSIVCTLVCI